MNNSLRKRYAAKLVSGVVNGLLGIAVVAIVPRALGPVSYGAFTFLTTFFSNIVSFFDTGTSIAFYTKLSKRPHEKRLIGFYLLFVFTLLAISSMALSISLSPAIQPLIYGQNSNIFVVFGFCFAFLTWISQIAIRVSDAYAMTVEIEIIKTLHRLFFFIVIAAIAYFGILSLGGFFAYHFVLLFSFIAILVFYFYKRGVVGADIFSFDFGVVKVYVKEFYDYSHPLIVGTIFSTLSALFALWLLQFFYGNEQVGYYGFAYQIAAACFVFTAALTPIITREFAVAHQANDIEHMRKLFKRYIPMLYFVAAFFSIFLSFNADTVTNLFGGTDYSDAVAIVSIMALYPIHQTYGQLSGSVLYATENTKLSRNISIVSSVVFVLLSFLLLFPGLFFDLKLGAFGFTIAMIATQIVGVNIQLWYNCKFLDLRFFYFVWHQIFTVIFLVFLAYLSNIGIGLLDFNNLLNFLLAGFAYTVFVVLGIMFLPSLIALDRSEIAHMAKAIKSRFKK